MGFYSSTTNTYKFSSDNGQAAEQPDLSVRDSTVRVLSQVALEQVIVQQTVSNLQFSGKFLSCKDWENCTKYWMIPKGVLRPAN